jgi:hypothetical protein
MIVIVFTFPAVVHHKYAPSASALAIMAELESVKEGGFTTSTDKSAQRIDILSEYLFY